MEINTDRLTAIFQWFTWHPGIVIPIVIVVGLVLMHTGPSED